MKFIYIKNALFVFLVSLMIFGCGGNQTKIPQPMVEKKLSYSNASILLAVKTGNLNLVSKNLDNNININTLDSSGNSLIHIAVIKSNGPLLSLLLERSAKINILNSKKMTALHLAVKNNSLTLVNTLLVANASSSTLNDLGDSPIHTSIIDNNLPIIKALIKYDKKNLELTNKKGFTPLLLATNIQNSKLLSYFLNNSTHINATSNEGLSSLQYSVSTSSLNISKLLLNKGASLSQLTQDAQSLLHLSAKAGSLETAKYLVFKGLKANAKDKKGHYPVGYAIKGRHYEMVIFLLKTYSNFSDEEKYRALKYSVDEDSTKILISLHKGGVSLSILEPRTKSTILHYAVTLEHKEEIIKVILKNTSHIENKNAQGMTAIAYVIKNKKISYEEILRPYFLQARLMHIKQNYDFPSLKALYLQYPEVIKQIKNKKHIISLNGPHELMIGDLKILHNNNRSTEIIISQIKRLKTPYSNFDSYDINTLIALGLPALIISEVLDITDFLEKQAIRKKEIELSKNFQTSILNATNRSLKAQEEVTAIQKDNAKLTQQVIKNQEKIINNQKLTIQTLQTKTAGDNSTGNAITKEATKEITKQLINQFF